MSDGASTSKVGVDGCRSDSRGLIAFSQAVIGWESAQDPRHRNLRPVRSSSTSPPVTHSQTASLSRSRLPRPILLIAAIACSFNPFISVLPVPLFFPALPSAWGTFKLPVLVPAMLFHNAIGKLVKYPLAHIEDEENTIERVLTMLLMFAVSPAGASLSCRLLVAIGSSRDHALPTGIYPSRSLPSQLCHD